MWYLFKINRRQWRRSNVFIVNFELISQIVLVFPLLTFTWVYNLTHFEPTLLNLLYFVDHLLNVQGQPKPKEFDKEFWHIILVKRYHAITPLTLDVNWA